MERGALKPQMRNPQLEKLVIFVHTVQTPFFGQLIVEYRRIAGKPDELRLQSQAERLF